MSELGFRACGEAGLLLDLGQEADVSTAAKVRTLFQRISCARLPGIQAAVPSYASIWLEFDPEVWADAALRQALEDLAIAEGENTSDPERTIEVPVIYGQEAGPDLAEVAARAGLPEAEVVRRHAATEYRVLFLGFAPGFPYLGFSSPELDVTRLPTPRVRVAAGSVGLAGRFSGIYPQEGPGGWRIIGRTDLALFDATRSEPALMRPGDKVRFRPVES